jgi:phospholipase C
MSNPSIEHVIVLMLENRSFDHLLGYLPGGGGLTGKEFNRIDPSDPASGKVYVNKVAPYVSPISPAHDLTSVHVQLYGGPGPAVDPAPMDGFVSSAVMEAQGNVQVGIHVMDCFNPAKIPALRTLAEEFCLCTAWFSSIPGPTWPNRMFVHAATSDGVAANDVTHDFEMRTIYESLAEGGKSWTIYFGDIPVSLALRRLWGSLDHFRGFEEFHEDVRRGRLANYSFIEPRYLDFLAWKAADEHPPHDLKMGEYLIAEVYDALRVSPYWTKSLLVVLYDEHGGFFDRISPPVGVPNPDGKVSNDPAFDFTRLGLRVPAVLVSPFIEKGVRDPVVYEHASVPATLKKLFDLPGYLTARDRAARTFEGLLTREAPRLDAPLTLPVPGDPKNASQMRALLRRRSRVEALVDKVERERISTEPVSEFQASLVGLANHLEASLPPARRGRKRSVRSAGQSFGVTGDSTPQASAPLRNEHEAAQHVERVLSLVLKR